ncbi:MAG: GDSL-type esterase/lipase family protein [Bdellovibrionota bacterium]
MNRQFVNFIMIAFFFSTGITSRSFSQDLFSWPRPLVVGSIGDSISRATNSTVFGEVPFSSWATGGDTRVFSQAARLQEETGSLVFTYNYARSGAQMRHLRKQAQKLLKRKPDYVTILIGANDLCSWKQNNTTQLQAFESELRGTLDDLTTSSPKVKIILSAIPDMLRMYELGKQKGCSMMWKVFRFCSPLLGKDRTEMQRLQFYDRWIDANNSLASIADEYPNNVFFAESIKDYEFSKDDIAVRDCFHPSIKGQRALSEQIWNAGWFKAFQENLP